MVGSSPSRFRPRTFEVMLDVAVSVGIGGLAIVDGGSEPAQGPVVIGLLMAAALLARRYLPVTVMIAVYLLAPAHLLFGGAMRGYDLAVLVAMYSVVKYRAQLWWGIVAGGGAGIGVVMIAAVGSRHDLAFWNVLWLAGASTLSVWVIAYGVRTRRLYVASLEERAATLERERDHLARLAAADERAAIARELHDVVAHSLSVMIVQADGAGYALERTPAQAREALATIASTGREALHDMHRIVGVLRGAAAEPDVERQRVGLAELDQLVERAKAAGLRVGVQTAGTPAGLSAAEELTTYRIVQESLTNVLRHAGPEAAVRLRLSYAPERVSVEVSDDGCGRLATTSGDPTGHGLVGMRERVALHAGDLVAGPVLGGGWRVTATIPRVNGGRA